MNTELGADIELALFPIADGPGSVAHAPNLPDGFTDTFASHYIHANGVRLHAVVGGDGPALLLVHGWPENWYAWRLVMPELAKRFTVVAVDQRGVGLSDKPDTGYDTATLAADLVGVMDALDFERFAVVGHDTGFVVAYALAADYAHRVERLVLAETPSFGFEFGMRGGGLPAEVVDYYVGLLSEPKSLAGSLGLYRAFHATVVQNEERAEQKLTMPVLAVGGERSSGDHVIEGLRAVAEDVEGAVIPGAGHWVAEEAPDRLLEVLTRFLAPSRTAVTSELMLETSAR